MSLFALVLVLILLHVVPDSPSGDAIVRLILFGAYLTVLLTYVEHRVTGRLLLAFIVVSLAVAVGLWGLGGFTKVQAGVAFSLMALLAPFSNRWLKWI